MYFILFDAPSSQSQSLLTRITSRVSLYMRIDVFSVPLYVVVMRNMFVVYVAGLSRLCTEV